MLKHSYLLLLSFVALSFSACSSDSGRDLNIPYVRPPVATAAPVGFTSTSTSLNLWRLLKTPFGIQEATASGMSTELSAIKSRFFGDGPTDFLDRLEKVDGRLSEYKSRVKEDGNGACLDNAAQLWDLKAIPGVGDFPMYFQCKETMSGTSALDVYIGKKDGYWYIAELQINDSSNEPPTMAVLAKINEAGDQVAVVQASVENNFTTSIVHILADSSNKVFQVANASNRNQFNGSGSGANYTGVGCGVRIKSNSDFVYGVGIFNSEDCSQNNAATVCASSSSLESTDVSACGGAGLQTLTVMDLSASGLGEVSATGSGYLKIRDVVTAVGMPSLSAF